MKTNTPISIEEKMNKELKPNSQSGGEENIYDKYPIAWKKYNTSLDECFPKGDKRRGEVMAIVSEVMVFMNKETLQSRNAVVDGTLKLFKEGHKYTVWLEGRKLFVADDANFTLKKEEIK